MNPSRALSYLLGALLAFLPLASCAFSLNGVVKDYWYYVDNHLADTTSQACLDAYNVPIDCDQTLLGIVSSGSPNFNPGPDDLARTCVATCSDSLDAWIQNVKSVCTASGDGALLETNSRPRPQVPIAVVGEVFQYAYAYACSRNVSGWCYFNYPSSPEWARADFTCSNECASQFFEDAHDLPGSNYTFMVYDLNQRSDWWETQWAEGYQHLLDCQSGSASSDGPLTTTAASDSETTTTTKSASRTSTSTKSQGHSSSATTRATSSSSSTGTLTSSSSVLATTTPSSNAGRLLPHLLFGGFR